MSERGGAMSSESKTPDLFRVVWSENGEPADDLEGIALNCEWAKGLMYCDMQGFAVEADGALLLMDECGNHRYPPEGLFQVQWLKPLAGGGDV